MPTSRQCRDQGIALYRSSADGGPGVGLVCTGFGVQRIRQWVVDRSLGEFAMVFVDEGSGWLETPAGGRQRITAPAVFQLHPGVMHSYGPDEGTAWHERWVLFSGPLTAAFLDAGLLDPTGLPIEVGGPAEIAELFGILHRDFVDASPLGHAAAAADLHRLIVRAAMLGHLGEARRGKDRLDEAIEALRQRAFGPVDLAALPRGFGLAPATFRRRLQARLGVSPKTFVARLRSARAKELLAVTELSIAAVAQAVGYEDPYYFARVFGAREKLTPSEFRRRNQRA